MSNFQPEALRLKQQNPLYINRGFIAGGAVTSVFTNSNINDVDIYFATREDFETAVFQAYEDGLWCVASSKRSVTFSDQGRVVQLMHFEFFPTPADVFDAFDFTINMGAYDLSKAEFVLHDDFLKHNSQRFLRFHPGTRYPLASAARVLKYLQRGYTLSKSDMLKIVLASRKTQIESWEDLADQIGGAYGDKVLLRTEGQEYSIEAAIAALTVDDEGNDTWIVPFKNDQPGDAEALLKHIAEMKGEDTTPGQRDEDGWPIAA